MSSSDVTKLSNEVLALGAEVAAIIAAAPCDALAQARVVAARALAADSVDSAFEINRLGSFFFQHGFNAEALPLYEAGLALVRRSPAPDASIQAMFLSNIGQVHERECRYDAAVAAFEASLQLKDEAGDSPRSKAITSDNLAATFTRMGQPARALPLHEAALAIFEQGAAPYDAHVGTALHNLSQALQRCGHPQRALACSLRALDIQLARGPAGQGDAVLAAAGVVDLALAMQDIELAGEVGDWLLATAAQTRGMLARHVGQCLLALAEAAFDHASLALAERAAVQARALLSRAAGAGEDGRAGLRAHSLLAAIHRHKGNYFEAERLQFQLLGRLRRDERVTGLIELAKSLRERGVDCAAQSVALIEMAIRALDAPADVGESDESVDSGADGDGVRRATRTAEWASAWGNLGESLFRAGRVADADAAYRHATAAIADQPDSEQQAWLASGHASVHFHAGRDADALAAWTLARDRWAQQRGSSHPWVAQCEHNRAMVLWQLGQADEAEAAMARAIAVDGPELARRLLLGSDVERAAVARCGVDALHRVLSFHLANGAAGELAANLLLQRKAAAQQAQLQSLAGLRQALSDDEAQMLDALSGIQARIARRVAADQLHDGRSAQPQALAALQDEAERLERQLAESAAAGRFGVRSLTWAEIQAGLPAGTWLVEYLQLARFTPRDPSPVASEFVAMMLGPDGPPRWQALGPAVVIDAAVNRARAALLLGLSEDDPPDPAPELTALAVRTTQPLAAALASARHIVVAADGMLNWVPFGLLWTLTLGRSVDVTQLASGAERLQVPPTPGQAGPPLAIVDPDFGAGPGGFEPLPATRQEALALAAAWPDTEMRAGTEATVDALTSARRPWLLHIATHGHFLPQAARQPRADRHVLSTPEGLLIVDSTSPSAYDDTMQHGGLALAGANALCAEEAAGVVTARQLAQLDLLGTELVVLSACDTGLGNAEMGQEFAGLRRAFAMAGARSQLTALWAVEDEAGAVFMQTFYAALAGGASRVDALALGQAAVRTVPDWSHPAFWAGFVLWGEAGPLGPPGRRLP